jgi:O-methyltransferase
MTTDDGAVQTTFISRLASFFAKPNLWTRTKALVARTFREGPRSTYLRNKGGWFLNHGYYGEAIKCFEGLFRGNPTNRTALGELARAYLRAGRMGDLRRLAQKVDMHSFDEVRPIFLHDISETERAICVEVGLDACQTPEAIAQLCRSVEYLIRYGIDGDLVECGVYRGASIIAMIRTLQNLGAERTIWLYDTFEGMPKPEAVDVFYAAGEEHDGGLKSWEILKRPDESGSDWVYCPLEEVRQAVLATKYPPQLLKFVKGKVEDTIPHNSPASIALLRLDTDFHSSTKHELIHLYPRLSKGGVLILDDYGAYRGARQAADEFFTAEPFHMSRIDEHVRVGIKA